MIEVSLRSWTRGNGTRPIGSWGEWNGEQALSPWSACYVLTVVLPGHELQGEPSFLSELRWAGSHSPFPTGHPMFSGRWMAIVHTGQRDSATPRAQIRAQVDCKALADCLSLVSGKQWLCCSSQQEGLEHPTQEQTKRAWLLTWPLNLRSDRLESSDQIVASICAMSLCAGYWWVLKMQNGLRQMCSLTFLVGRTLPTRNGSLCLLGDICYRRLSESIKK